MLQNRAPQPFDPISIPGKVFLLGEYAVLAGVPAIAVSVAPRFEMRCSPHLDVMNASGGGAFHPKSPIARLERWARKQGAEELDFQFDDPYQGAGGFGASTAQFAMAYCAYANHNPKRIDRHWSAVWKLYRELMSDEALVPSGADLVAQWQGGVTYFDGENREVRDLWSKLDWTHLLVFSAAHLEGRKVPTHEHLEILSKRGFPQDDRELVSRLATAFQEGNRAIEKGSLSLLGKTMDDYADILQAAGLEVGATYKDRKALRQLPGVLGVKGAGALQSDCVLVLMQEGQGRDLERDQVIQEAESRGLRLISRGLTCQMGVTCQK